MGRTEREVGTGRVVVRETDGPGGVTAEVRVDGKIVALLGDDGQVGVFDPWQDRPVMLMSQFVARPAVTRTMTPQPRVPAVTP